MRTLQRFRMENRLTLKDLCDLLIKNDLIVAFSTVGAWCSSEKSKKNPSIKNAKKLAKITGYKLENFYQDYSEKEILDKVEYKTVTDFNSSSA